MNINLDDIATLIKKVTYINKTFTTNTDLMTYWSTLPRWQVLQARVIKVELEASAFGYLHTRDTNGLLTVSSYSLDAQTLESQIFYPNEVNSVAANFFKSLTFFDTVAMVKSDYQLYMGTNIFRADIKIHVNYSSGDEQIRCVNCPIKSIVLQLPIE